MDRDVGKYENLRDHLDRYSTYRLGSLDYYHQHFLTKTELDMEE